MSFSQEKHSEGRRCQPDTPRWEDGSSSQGRGERQWRCGREPSRVEDSGASRSGAGMSTASQPMYPWHTMRWPTSERQVLTLQQRIYRAAQRGDDRQVRRRQTRLRRSHDAKLLAVRQVPQANRGQKTPGVDGIAALTPVERRTLAEHLPLRRERRARASGAPFRNPGTRAPRPLGIPTIAERAKQGLRQHTRWNRNGKRRSNPRAMAFARDVAPGRRSERSMSRSTRNRHGSWMRTSPKASIASTTTLCDASSTPSQRSIGHSTPG